MHHPSFNIGINEEYQIVDPTNGELVAFVSQTMSDRTLALQERSSEFDLAERIGSDILRTHMPPVRDIHEARVNLVRTREKILELAEQNGMRIIVAGTHPVSNWDKSAMPSLRYINLMSNPKMMVRRMLTFGLHVHIGLEDRELSIDVMNAMRYLLPHMLTLSTSSPFWNGRNTGLKCYRKVLVDALPRSGIPGLFSSYQEYRDYVNTLVNTNCIPDPGKIYYDVIPHHRHQTLVIRICDVMPSINDTLAVVALIQAVVAWMVDLRRRNMTFRIYDRTLLNENRWRALRYGLDGTLIDFGVEEEKPARDLIRELLTRIEPTAQKLNSLHELDHIHTILERGSSADMQIDVWEAANQNPRAVIDYLIQETEKLA
ncbi:MAG: carboxylate-amine ligase [Caldilineaceae bacterium]|nr:carboxylate-amine ligase [Caldilineaceae bacterium]